MATQVQFRRGTTAETNSFIGASGEVTVDTTKNTCVVHNGTQAGGFPLLRQDGSNSEFSPGSLGSCALKFVGDPNTGIISPGADQVGFVTNGILRLLADGSGNISISGNLSVSGTTTSSSPGLFPSGSAAAPSISFSADTNTGIYNSGADSISLVTNGTDRLTINSTGVVSTPNSFELRNQADLRFYESTGSGTNFVAFQAPGSITSNLTWILPSTDATVSGYALVSDTAGNLSWGKAGGAAGGGTDDIFYENGQTVTTNYTLTTNKNAISAGPITINSGVTVTIPSGQSWAIV